MWNWLRKNPIDDAVRREARETLRAVEALPIDVQRAVARDLFLNIKQGNLDLERASDGVELSIVSKSLVARAMGLRHAALEAGATDRQDQRWAAAALFESWAVSMQPIVSPKTRRFVIDDIISDFLTDTLTTDELIELDRQFESGSDSPPID